MSNTRDNGPELDYYELRRRHEAYKNRARELPRQAQEGDAPRVARPLPRKSPDETFEPTDNTEYDLDAAEADEAQDNDYDAEDIGGDDFEDADMPVEDENPNPFDSFIRFFHGVKGNLNARKQGRQPEEDDYADEDDGEDIGENENAPRRARVSSDADFDDDDEEYFDDDEGEDEETHRESGFKKLLNLFVTRVDDSELEDEDEDFDDEDGDEDDFYVSPSTESAESGAEPADAPGTAKGGQTMDQENNAMEQQFAESLETSGMTRRQRRELAMRRAAEQSAASVAEDAPTAPVQPVAEDIAAQPTPETPAAEDAPAQSEPEYIDEPTREFTPVKLTEKSLFDTDDDEDEDEEDDEEEEKPRRGLFARFRKSRDEDEDDDLDDEDDDDDEVEDEDEDEEEEKPRRSLFGFRRKSAEPEDDEDEDEDDGLDDEDEDDDDDEDDDEEEERPRRGLFGRRHADDDDEDDDDLDDEDKEDEEDEDDDQYDEYDDDDDAYDDEDDDEFDDGETHRSFGHHLIGVFKAILGIIVALLVIIIALNFLYVGGHDTIVPKMHDALGDSSAFKLLFFGYDMRQNIAPEATETPLPEVTPEPTLEAEATPEPTAEVEIPNLSASTPEPLTLDGTDGVDAAVEPAADAAVDGAASIG